jgi:L-amino acid N-acyltransferase YncA
MHERGEMRIREARESDGRVIATVCIASWRSTYRGIVPDAHLASLSVAASQQRWREACAPSGGATCIYVAEEPGAGVIGFAVGGPVRDDVPGFDAELHAIYFLQQAQARGGGRRLVGAVGSRLHGAGLRSMMVWALAANRSRGFYEALGGRQVGERTVIIGGAELPEIAYGWDDLGACLARNERGEPVFRNAAPRGADAQGAGENEFP